MIDPNKTYKTRDGREVRIYAVDGDAEGAIHGAILEKYGWRICSWTDTGKWLNGSVDRSDLIEVRPRIQREVWVNVYAGHEHVYSCKIDAENGRARHCIACVKLTIDCKEGEGL